MSQSSDGHSGKLRRDAGQTKNVADRVGITINNLSLLKKGKVKGIRFNTLAAICRELDCQPGDILEYNTTETTSDESERT